MAATSRRPSPSTPSRRTIALKRADGEPLTRADIQFDVLHNIFHDTHDVFTDPYPEVQPAQKICFRDLYLKYILHSPKATKALKDKMFDSQTFAEDFGMLALLVNVGRVNTTMSFFPEMKTAIRTYHPIPALQRTTGNLQDAPRIKHILKSSVLDGEQANTPSIPAEILARARAGRVPSTTVTNLIFVMANHSSAMSQAHFSNQIDFIDVFLRKDISSFSRAQAFLWLCYHYLEAPSTDGDDNYDDDGPSNPFADQRRGNMPNFVFLSEAETAHENKDPPEELALAAKLVAQRNEILRSHEEKESNKALISAGAMSLGGDEDPDSSETKVKGKRGPAKAKASPSKVKKAPAKSRRSKLKEETVEREIHTPAPDSEDGYDAVPRPVTTSHPNTNEYPRHQYRHESPPIESHVTIRHPLRPSIAGGSSGVDPPNRHRFSPYRKSHSKPIHDESYRPPSRLHPVNPRSMLQHAWHIVSTTDPLLDSDNELELEGEHIRHDYIQRLKVISTLRRKEPTPESEHIVMQVAVADPHAYLSD